PYLCFPAVPARAGYGNGSAAERADHPLLYNPLQPDARDHAFALSNLEALLRYGDTGSPTLTSALFPLCPQDLPDRTHPPRAPPAGRPPPPRAPRGQYSPGPPRPPPWRGTKAAPPPRDHPPPPAGAAPDADDLPPLGRRGGGAPPGPPAESGKRIRAGRTGSR